MLARLAMCCVLSVAVAQVRAEAVKLYVSPRGSDEWGGRLPEPNGDGTDGPFRSVACAQAALRAMKGRAGGLPRPATVFLRGEAHYLDAPLTFGHQDSGSGECPVTYRSYPSERAVISAGHPVRGWRKGRGQVWEADLPAEAKGWRCDQLFVAGRRQIRARHPNYDPDDPAVRGFLFSRPQPNSHGDYGTTVTFLPKGYWIEFDISVPADGEYRLWFLYAAQNEPWGATDMAGRCSLLIDGQRKVDLAHLPDTSNWRQYRWSQQPNAVAPLSAGEHTLRWTNDKGPGLNIDAIALSADPAWKPTGRPKPGPQLAIVQAETYARHHGENIRVERKRSPDTVYFDRAALEPLTAGCGGTLVIWIYEPHGLCSNTMAPIAAINPAEGWLRTSTPIPAYGYPGHGVYIGARFFVENAREALDAPGEWYFDRDACRLYYWPHGPDFAQQRVVVSRLDRIMEVHGNSGAEQPVEHLRFVDLTFEATGYALQKDSWYHSESAAVWLRDARHCRFESCTFSGLGGAAVVMNGHCTQNTIAGCEVAHTGAGGFTINSQPENLYHLDPKRYTQASTCHTNEIVGNHIHHTGEIWKHGAGIYLHATSHNAVKHNDIHDTSRHPIIITGSAEGNAVEFNHILHTNLETGDTGAIHTYMIRNPATPNRICNNVIGDVIGLGTTADGEFLRPYYTWGIYLDGYTSRTIVRHNIVYRTVRGGIFVHGGNDNLIENNILVDSQTTQTLLTDIRKTKATGNRFLRNVVAYSAEGATLGLAHRSAALRWESDYNVFWYGGREIPELPSLRENGLDRHSIVGDPLFVDAAGDDYRLRPESPAFELGFKAIDTSRVGRRGWRPLAVRHPAP